MLHISGEFLGAKTVQKTDREGKVYDQVTAVLLDRASMSVTNVRIAASYEGDQPTLGEFVVLDAFAREWAMDNGKTGIVFTAVGRNVDAEAALVVPASHSLV